MKRNKIAFASDHAGFSYKTFLMEQLGSDFEVHDFGCNNEQSCDYPDFAHLLATAVENKECDFGIAICGSGNGINMTVNKHQNIRGALCWTAEIAKFARLHNDANVCSIPARFISQEEAKNIMSVFLNTDFEGGRHQLRVDKISLKN